MLLVPTVVALYKAHVERLARISAAAIRIEPVIIPEADPAIAEAVERFQERERQKKRDEDRRVARELAAEKKRLRDLSRGVVVVEQSAMARPTPFFAELLTEVSVFYAIPTVALKSARRDGPTAYARQVACYIAYKETGLSLPAVGRLLGNRDHTTILHSVRKIDKLLKDGDENLAVAIITIKLRVRDRVQSRVNSLTAVA